MSMDEGTMSSGEHRNIKSIDARAATLRLQAATRGMLSRRSFQRAKKQTMASLVIFQWWMQSNKSHGSGNTNSNSNNDNSSSNSSGVHVHEEEALDCDDDNSLRAMELA